jgi:glucose-1-phosphate thymidylyltransferase
MKKGIILAGGSGTRLYPITSVVSKQLLPVYDKPMIYYSLSVLMLAGIRDIILISTPRALPEFERLLDDGSHLGMRICYATQDAPRGIADAFRVSREFLAQDSVALVLADNILFGAGLKDRLHTVTAEPDPVVFCYKVADPERYGVIELNRQGHPVSIEEKPAAPRSNLAIIGLYFYPNDVVKLAENLQPSRRNELEITDINRIYMQQERLRVVQLTRGYAWLDAGNESALLDASNFIAAIQTRQDLKIGCIEEIAWRLGWISRSDLQELARRSNGSTYGAYVAALAEGGD